MRKGKKQGERRRGALILSYAQQQRKRQRQERRSAPLPRPSHHRPLARLPLVPYHNGEREAQRERERRLY